MIAKLAKYMRGSFVDPPVDYDLSRFDVVPGYFPGSVLLLKKPQVGEEYSTQIDAKHFLVKAGAVEINTPGGSGMGTTVMIDGVLVKGLRRLSLTVDYESATELTITQVVMPQRKQ